MGDYQRFRSALGKNPLNLFNYEKLETSKEQHSEK